MTQEDIHRASREIYGTLATEQEIRFATIIAAAEREKVAHWMRNCGYATGHGDTIEDLLAHLGTQIAEGLKVEVLMEREACADICDEHDDLRHANKADLCATEIRARGNK